MSVRAERGSGDEGNAGWRAAKSDGGPAICKRSLLCPLSPGATGDGCESSRAALDRPARASEGAKEGWKGMLSMLWPGVYCPSCSTVSGEEMPCGDERRTIDGSFDVSSLSSHDCRLKLAIARSCAPRGLKGGERKGRGEPREGDGAYDCLGCCSAKRKRLMCHLRSSASSSAVRA